MTDSSESDRRLAHAQHNESVCDFLYESNRFPDWVVTTAFYAALHYLECLLFPKTALNHRGEMQEFDTFDRWYSKGYTGRSNKHAALKDLVQSNCEGFVSTSYRALHDNSHTARYNNYRIKPALAEKCRRDLKRIRDYCIAEAKKAHD